MPSQNNIRIQCNHLHRTSHICAIHYWVMYSHVREDVERKACGIITHLKLNLGICLCVIRFSRAIVSQYSHQYVPIPCALVMFYARLCCLFSQTWPYLCLDILFTVNWLSSIFTDKFWREMEFLVSLSLVNFFLVNSKWALCEVKQKRIFCSKIICKM